MAADTPNEETIENVIQTSVNGSIIIC